MAAPKIKSKVPGTVKAGEVVEIKTVIGHDMESGQRKDKQGNKIPRQIINKFVATFNGKEVFTSDWHPAISANPYLAFHIAPKESGTLEMAWHDDSGDVYKESAEIKVTG